MRARQQANSAVSTLDWSSTGCGQSLKLAFAVHADNAIERRALRIDVFGRLKKLSTNLNFARNRRRPSRVQRVHCFKTTAANSFRQTDKVVARGFNRAEGEVGISRSHGYRATPSASRNGLRWNAYLRPTRQISYDIRKVPEEGSNRRSCE